MYGARVRWKAAWQSLAAIAGCRCALVTLPFASQHSPSFLALLRELGAAVLVSTYQANQLILLRAQGTVLSTHFTALERPMGLAMQGNTLALGAGFQVWEYRNLPAVAEKLSEAHDGVWLPRWSHVTDDIDVHELAYTNDGTLWLVNTRLPACALWILPIAWCPAGARPLSAPMI